VVLILEYSDPEDIEASGEKNFAKDKKKSHYVKRPIKETMGNQESSLFQGEVSEKFINHLRV